EAGGKTEHVGPTHGRVSGREGALTRKQRAQVNPNERGEGRSWPHKGGAATSFRVHRSSKRRFSVRTVWRKQPPDDTKGDQPEQSGARRLRPQGAFTGTARSKGSSAAGCVVRRWERMGSGGARPPDRRLTVRPCVRLLDRDVLSAAGGMARPSWLRAVPAP